jgi:hypothetical protein
MSAAKMSAWVLGGVIILTLILYRGCMNSKAEGASSTSVSWSPSDAKERKKFIRPVRVVPSSFIWKGQQVVVDSAWIERESQVHFHLLFLKSYEYSNNYRLVFMLKDMNKFEDRTFGFVSPSANGMGTQSSGRGKPYVQMGFLGSQYPDTIQVTVTDGPTQVGTLAFIPI